MNARTQSLTVRLQVRKAPQARRGRERDGRRQQAPAESQWHTYHTCSSRDDDRVWRDNDKSYLFVIGLVPLSSATLCMAALGAGPHASLQRPSSSVGGAGGMGGGVKPLFMY